MNNGTERESASTVRTHLMTLLPLQSGSYRKGALRAAALPLAAAPMPAS